MSNCTRSSNCFPLSRPGITSKLISSNHSLSYAAAPTLWKNLPTSLWHFCESSAHQMILMRLATLISREAGTQEGVDLSFLDRSRSEGIPRYTNAFFQWWCSCRRGQWWLRAAVSPKFYFLYNTFWSAFQKTKTTKSLRKNQIYIKMQKKLRFRRFLFLMKCKKNKSNNNQSSRHMQVLVDSMLAYGILFYTCCSFHKKCMNLSGIDSSRS